MSNILLGFPNRLDGAAVYGGSWSAGLPLSNLQSRLFAKTARSVDLDPASTTFTLDFGQPRKLRILALIAHTIGLSGRIRFEVSEAADFTSHLYDFETDVWTGLLTVEWDINALEWESDNFWLGTYSREEIEGMTAVSTHVMPQEITGRYLRVSIVDIGNSDGFVQIGRVFAGPGISPRLNYSWGASLGYDIATAVETALGGAEFFDVREPIRVFRFALEFMRDDEAFGKFLELVRRAGLHGEIFVIPDPADDLNGLRRNFLGRIRQPSALEQATWANAGSAHNMAFEIKELR